MRIIALVFLIALSGCAEKYAYAPQQKITESEAKSIIEQVFMELPADKRPEIVQFTPDYIWIGSGVRSQRNSTGAVVVLDGAVAVGSSTSNVITKGVGERIYYNSIGETQLFTKRSYYVIRILNKDGHSYRQLTTYSQESARKFVDAMDYFRRKTE